MIITKTPLRVCFFSGGSDLPSFYEKEDGASLSVTINKYIHVIAHQVPNMGVKVMYDDVEELHDLEQMRHAITRETLKLYNVNKEITVASISDIVSKGSGLGSSSAFTVGLVKAMSALKKESVSGSHIADIACQIEMVKCGYPVGKQDQYAAAYGGFNLFKFHTNGSVSADSITLNNKNIQKLQDNLLLVYSGRGRDANNILQKQQKAMSNIDKFKIVQRARDKAYEGRDLLLEGKVDEFGELLHKSWLDKKNICEDITQDYFDAVYEKAIDAGALGGKLLGAGGGGFFIFYVPQKDKEGVAWEVTRNTACKVYDFEFTGNGSNIVYHHP